MTGTKKQKSALSVSEGVTPHGAVNKDAVNRMKQVKKRPASMAELRDGVLAGDIPTLSRAITLVESALSQHQEEAQELLASCLPHSGKAFRLGITGVPGAGKSTFIETMGKHIIKNGGKLAVLAIDPSSELSKGSILGDKTRMEELAGSPGAYIRPSPSGGTLGGVARKTRETIILCEAAGFENIIVETVGVGQSETAVHGMVDFFLLVMIAGAGDELQGIKRGIMEMADAIVINKADGTNIKKAERARAEFANALHLFPPSPSGWEPLVKTCSSLHNYGIEEVWKMVMDYRDSVTTSGYLDARRNEQSKFWMYESIREGIYRQFFDNPELKKQLEEYEKAIDLGQITSFMAATAILNKYKSTDKNS